MATTVVASNKMLVFSGYPHLYINTFLNDLWIVLIGCYFPTPVPPAEKIQKGVTNLDTLELRFLHNLLTTYERYQIPDVAFH